MLICNKFGTLHLSGNQIVNQLQQCWIPPQVKGAKSSAKHPPQKFLLSQEGKDFEEEDDLEDTLDEDDESDEEGSDIDFASVAAVAAAGKVLYLYNDT